jgi:DNA processing protein
VASRRELEGWLLPDPRPPERERVLRAQAARAASTLERLGARVIPRNDAEYPAALNDLPDPPRALFVRGGSIPESHRSVAIVGSRAASRYGAALASRLAGDLARLGIAVVSGLARGIDAAAHRGALDAGGATLAVLPSGLDTITPQHHQALAEEIAVRSVLLTERGFGGPRFRGEFVERNRLIAALAGATVVVEAAVRSGALSTAAVARTLGRAVLAVPGDVDRETARGCHALLRVGADLCESAADVVRALERWSARSGVRPAPPADTAEARLLAALGEEPLGLERLAEVAGVPLPEALAGLLALQWSGSAAPRPGQRWVRAIP